MTMGHLELSVIGLLWWPDKQYPLLSKLAWGNFGQGTQEEDSDVQGNSGNSKIYGGA